VPSRTKFVPSISLPEPLSGVRPVRSEDQHWQRLNRAEGWLRVGYDGAGRPVRIEYHWVRYFSHANPRIQDVYTAELWMRQPQGHWLYIIQPGQDGFVEVEHEPLRDLLASHLNIDLGD